MPKNGANSATGEVEVVAEFTDLVTGAVSRRRVALKLVSQRPGEFVVTMGGGPTGYESFRVRRETCDEMSQSGWVACAGTPSRFDHCFVSADEMSRAFDLLWPLALCAPGGRS